MDGDGVTMTASSSTTATPSATLASGPRLQTGKPASTAAAQPPPFSLQLPPLAHIKDVIVLSMFDGMGSAAFAVQQPGFECRLFSQSEVDAPSNRVSKF